MARLADVGRVMMLMGCAIIGQAAWADPVFGSSTPLNRLRILGSHNSYRPAFTPATLAAQRALLGAGSAGVEYGHPPIARQLDLGLRQLEFDPVADPRGGLYAAPYVGRPRAYAIMAKSGPKVLHVPFTDRRTWCLTLAACFGQVARWSHAHPAAAPIVITVNPSGGRTGDPVMPVLPPFDGAALDAVDRAARGAFGRAGLLTPDDVRGGRATLRDAVTQGGWPTVRAARGKVLLVLDTDDAVLARYRRGHPGLRGRAMFGFYPAAAPEAAFLNVQDPRGHEGEIGRAVAAGFIVRTRADADTVEARHHDHRRAEAAFRSGAQIVSTDYYAGAADPLRTGFVVGLPR